MKKKHVPINDLHGLVWDDYMTLLADDQLHLSEAGQIACAKAVVGAIEPYL